MVQQAMKQCDAVNDNMAAYHDLYNLPEGSFDGCEISHIGRASNEEADQLANIGSTRAPIPPGIFLEQINVRSIKIKPPIGSQSSTTDSRAAPEKIDTEKDEHDDECEHEKVMLIEPGWTQPYLDYMV